MTELNTRYATALASTFIITIGDEFQGLLVDPTALPDVIWDVQTLLDPTTLRFGVGHGALFTAIQSRAIGMDGPAFHRAREAIDRARAESLTGAVFAGFGGSADAILNGLARLLEHQRTHFTDKQRQAAHQLRRLPTQVDVAQSLGLSRQAVNDRLRKMGWRAYLDGEHAWRTALKLFAERARPEGAADAPP